MATDGIVKEMHKVAAEISIYKNNLIHLACDMQRCQETLETLQGDWQTVRLGIPDTDYAREEIKNLDSFLARASELLAEAHSDALDHAINSALHLRREADLRRWEAEWEIRRRQAELYGRAAI
jgi:hypothetical protein